MARSMLVYQELPEPEVAPATLVGLHGQGGDLDQLVPLAREMGAVRFVAPQAARAVSPITQGSSPSSDGFTWFFIQEAGYPEPATFGEGLWLVEQFIYDVRERQETDRPVFVLGYDQGAVLAVTLAGVLPESLAGVVAIGGYLPEIRGWSLPIEDLAGLPVLLIHDPSDAEIPLALVEKTAEELVRRRAAVELQQLPGARRDLMAPAASVRQWLDRYVAGHSS